MPTIKSCNTSLVTLATVMLFYPVVSLAQLDQLSRDDFLEIFGRESQEDEFDFSPLMYFNSDIQESSTVNSYLLSCISDRLYSDDFFYSDEWVEKFVADVETTGGFNVQFKSYPV